MKTNLFFILGIIFLCGCKPNIDNPKSVSNYLEGNTYYLFTKDLSYCQIVEFKENNVCVSFWGGYFSSGLTAEEIKELTVTSKYTVNKIDKNAPICMFNPKIAEDYVLVSIERDDISLFNKLLFNKDGDLSNILGNDGGFKKTNKSIDEIIAEYQKLVNIEFEKLRKIINPNEKTN